MNRILREATRVVDQAVNANVQCLAHWNKGSLIALHVAVGSTIAFGICAPIAFGVPGITVGAIAFGFGLAHAKAMKEQHLLFKAHPIGFSYVG